MLDEPVLNGLYATFPGNRAVTVPQKTALPDSLYPRSLQAASDDPCT